MSSGSMPELLQEVTGHLVSVEEGLAALDHHKTALHNHAHMVKGEISNAVERQMAALRNKEKQLIRQVEVASTHQNCEVNVTQAQLLQHKGALAVTRTFLDNCSITAPNSPTSEDSDASARIPCNASRQERAGSECRGAVCGRDGSGGSNNTMVSTVRNTIATTVNSLPHHDVAGLLQHTEKLLRVPLVKVSVDESALSSAIQRFGRVSSPPSLSHSELLPQCLEEYGDAEHHVLHKSVVRPDAPLPPIDVRRPYLLAAKRNTLNIAAVAASGEIHGNNGALPIPAAAAVKRVDEKEDLVKWLHRMQLDTSAEAEPQQYSAHSKAYSEVCVEEACQANESCAAFSSCLMAGQCKKNALEKMEQSAKWRQQQQQQHPESSCTPAEEPVSFLLQPKPVVSSRKRPLSDTTSSQAARNVIAHMTDILSSGNGSWLLPKGNKELCNSINQLNLVEDGKSAATAGFCYQENSGLCCSTPLTSNSNNQEASKKMKVCHGGSSVAAGGQGTDVAINNRLNSLRSAILYRAPSDDCWVLPAASAGPVPGSAGTESEGHIVPVPRVPVHDAAATDAVVVKPISWDGTSDTWLLPLRGDAPLQQVSVKKANCDKENNLCRASMKSQQSLISMESIENLKERVDRIMTDASDKKQQQPTMLSDLEEKELWLLQLCPSIKADNKVLDQVMKEKCEWLSNSSLSSFSIITDPDCGKNSWLMNEQL